MSLSNKISLTVLLVLLTSCSSNNLSANTGDNEEIQNLHGTSMSTEHSDSDFSPTKTYRKKPKKNHTEKPKKKRIRTPKI